MSRLRLCSFSPQTGELLRRRRQPRLLNDMGRSRIGGSAGSQRRARKPDRTRDCSFLGVCASQLGFVNALPFALDGGMVVAVAILPVRTINRRP